jgi:O-succinylbenzoate synthase
VRIESIELREIAMRLLNPFETSFGITQARRIILVQVTTDVAEGIGEVTCNEVPGYSYETTDTAWHILRDFLAPRTIGAEVATPGDLEALFKPIRGHLMAKAGIETALWDAFARAAGQPLWRYLGGVREVVPVGVSVGIRPDPLKLAEDVTRLAGLGYRRVKLKIAPGRDVDFVRAARRALPETPITVDANSSYTLSDADRLASLDEFGLLYIEQPLEHDDIIDHATLAKRLRTPICLDESIHHAGDVRKAVQLGAGKVINLKLGRVGGHLEAQRIARYCGEEGLGLWCGGMLESGIGRAHNLAMQSHAAFNHASDTAPSSNYWEEDIIDPPVTMHDGMVRMADGPGIGVALRKDLIDARTVRVEHYR